MVSKEEMVYEDIAHGWITGCYRLITGVSLVQVELVGSEPESLEAVEEAKNERRISIKVEFVDDGIEIGVIVLTRINDNKTLVQISCDSLPDNTLIMYDLRGQNGEIRQRFEKIRETAPTTVAAVVDAVVKKLDSAGLLKEPKARGE